MKKGVAIALAWPETKCKCPNSWYDGIAELLGISKEHYYKVGHAAVVLINRQTGKCYYYDFGRYHSPYGFGRLRSAETDHELNLQTEGVFDSYGKLLNTEDILNEIRSTDVWHGVGEVVSAKILIDFEAAISKAKSMQNKGFIRYGPFVFTGTNCSRFVRTVLLSGSRSFFTSLILRFPLTITPSPITNVKALKYNDV